MGVELWIGDEFEHGHEKKALLEGNYEWSRIAYQLWPALAKEVCRKDRSIAIAHGLDGSGS